MIDFKKMLGQRFICPLCGFPQGKVGVTKKGLPFYFCLVCHSRLFLNADLAMNGFIELLQYAKEKLRGKLMKEQAKDMIGIVNQSELGVTDFKPIVKEEVKKND